ncbi:MAG: Asp-tRNA(Asn)/Glu-tRNA(Gln) amidotransferase subunit GatC [bacterium]
MPIDASEVERIATLAKLRITGEDSERFALQFQQILDYFEQLENISTTDIEPTYHALEIERLETPQREDQAVESLSAEEVMANAPSNVENQFKVPKVIE